jgi:hypothetical protein
MFHTHRLLVPSQMLINYFVLHLKCISSYLYCMFMPVGVHYLAVNYLYLF